MSDEERDEPDEAAREGGDPEADEPQRPALLLALGVTIAAAGAASFAFDPEAASLATSALPLGALYAGLAVYALLRLRWRGELAVMRPRSGDLTFGALVAAVLYGGAMAGRLALLPQGTPQEGWLIRTYLLLGDPDVVNMHLLAGGIFVVAALEEVVWRGLVMRALAGPFGWRRAWLFSTLLYGAAHLPAAALLAAPTAGYNPLLPAAALGCGFVFGYLALRTQRMLPSIFAHALFTWAVVEFPLWTLQRPM